MKILFITPGYEYKSYFVKLVMWLRYKFIFSLRKSLAFPILAALSPKEYDFEVVEGGHEKINYDGDYDLVGIAVITRDADLSYEMADRFRAKGVKVVLGGWHPSALPEEAKHHADAIVIGEAEETWPQLLKDFETGKLKPFYSAERPVDPSLIPRLRMDIYPPKEHLSSVQATRGCPTNCEFCSVTHAKFGNNFRMRPIEDVIEDIKLISSRGFFFMDNSLTINLEYTKSLFRKIKPLNKKFYAYGNIGILGRDDELLKLASEAGCYAWYIGFESISQESINGIGKKTNKVESYLASIKKIHDNRMLIMGSFMFGFDQDTLDIFDKTNEFIKESEIDAPLFRIVTPFPGTSLFNRLEMENRILTKDWKKYDLNHVVFQPKHMSPEELQERYKWICAKQYNMSSGMSRILKSVKFGPNIFLQSSAMNGFYMWSFAGMSKRIDLKTTENVG